MTNLYKINYFTSAIFLISASLNFYIGDWGAALPCCAAALFAFAYGVELGSK